MCTRVHWDVFGMLSMGEAQLSWETSPCWTLSPTLAWPIPSDPFPSDWERSWSLPILQPHGAAPFPLASPCGSGLSLAPLQGFGSALGKVKP